MTSIEVIQADAPPYLEQVLYHPQRCIIFLLQERRAAAIAAQCAHMEPSPSEEERWRPDGDEWALGSKGADWPAIAMFRRTQAPFSSRA